MTGPRAPCPDCQRRNRCKGVTGARPRCEDGAPCVCRGVVCAECSADIEAALDRTLLVRYPFLT